MMTKSRCVMIGSLRFHTIDEAHRFLADGGNAGSVPNNWRWSAGYLIRVH